MENSRRGPVGTSRRQSLIVHFVIKRTALPRQWLQRGGQVPRGLTVRPETGGLPHPVVPVRGPYAVGRTRAGQDSIAGSNGTPSASHSASSITAGRRRMSAASTTGPPTSRKISSCCSRPRSASTGSERTRAYEASSWRGSRIRNACRNGRSASRSTSGSR